MYCPNCGTQVPDGTRFCGACGTALKERPGRAAVAAAAPPVQPALPATPVPTSPPPPQLDDAQSADAADPRAFARTELRHADHRTPTSPPRHGLPGWAIALIVVAVLVPVGLIVAAIAIPAYQNYLVRSQVNEGLMLAASAKTAEVEYRANFGQWPNSNIGAGLSPAASITGKYVSSLKIAPVGGVVDVTFSSTPPQQANQALDGKVLALVPTTGSDGSVTWMCDAASTTVPDKYLRSACRVAAPADTASAVAPRPQNTGAATPPLTPPSPPQGNIATVATLQDPSTADFAKYRVSIYSGKPVFPDFNGAQQKYNSYRTRIQEGVRRGVNFAGHYAIIEFGCGTDCEMADVADLRTGAVHDLPWSGENYPDLRIAAKPDSSLIVVRYRIFDDRTARYSACEQDVAIWKIGSASTLSKSRMPLKNDPDGGEGQCPEFPQNVADLLPGDSMPPPVVAADTREVQRRSSNAASPNTMPESSATNVANRQQPNSTATARDLPEQPVTSPRAPAPAPATQINMPVQQSPQSPSTYSSASAPTQPTTDELYNTEAHSQCASGFFGKACRHQVRERVCSGVAPGTPGATVCGKG